MADRAWKQFERDAAALWGGRRHPANSGHRVDFESATAIGQCKLVRVLSLERLTQLAEEMEREALPKGKAGVVCVKIRRGKGRPSPMLVVVTSAVWELMNGSAKEQGAKALAAYRAASEGVERDVTAVIKASDAEELRKGNNPWLR